MSSGEVITTDQEKMEMYMMCSKKSLAEMLIEANKTIVRLANSSEVIHNVSECDHPRSDRKYIGSGWFKCGVCRREFT